MRDTKRVEKQEKIEKSSGSEYHMVSTKELLAVSKLFLRKNKEVYEEFAK